MHQIKRLANIATNIS